MPERERAKKNPFRTTPTSRLYVHDACGNATEVSGYDFNRLANPFCWVFSTYCASCGGGTTLGRVRWADTNESIAHYRRRLRRKAPISLKLFVYLILPLLGLGIGGGVGWLSYAKNPQAGAFGGAVAGFVVFTGFLTPLASQFLWRIDYRNKR